VQPPSTDAEVLAIERPHPALWTYYLLQLIVILPLLPLLILPRYFRYHTMRYKFTEEGISMSWGILFRRQILLNYARIQDIHLHSNIVERWLGLARVQVQTASSSAAEMTIEGLKEFEAVRDFLYARMRGVKDLPGAAAPALRPAGTGSGELAAALHETARELRELRRVIEARAKK
jgi:putative membrane protein